MQRLGIFIGDAAILNRRRGGGKSREGWAHRGPVRARGAPEPRPGPNPRTHAKWIRLRAIQRAEAAWMRAAIAER